MVKINGKAEHTKGRNVESFKSGGDFLGAGEFTVIVKEVETENASSKNYITLVFENAEGKQYKHNVFLPPFKFDWQEERYVELLTRIGINLDTENGDLSFDTDQLINKPTTIVLKRKWNDDHEKLFVEFSYNKVWNKGDEVVNKPQPMTDEEKAMMNGGGSQAEENPYSNGQGPVDIEDDDLPF